MCLGKRVGYMERDLSPQSEAFKMHEATSKMFQAVQKTTFSFPWYAMFSTPLYRQFIQSARICHGFDLFMIQFLIVYLHWSFTLIRVLFTRHLEHCRISSCSLFDSHRVVEQLE